VICIIKYVFKWIHQRGNSPSLMLQIPSVMRMWAPVQLKIGCNLSVGKSPSMMKPPSTDKHYRRISPSVTTFITDFSDSDGLLQGESLRKKPLVMSLPMVFQEHHRGNRPSVMHHFPVNHGSASSVHK